MTGPSTEPTDVILAATHPHPGLGASLDRFVAEAGPLGRVVVVTPEAADFAIDHPSARQVRSPRGRLAPELWRDGLLATGSPLVAFSTTQMSPSAGWLAGLTAALRDSGAAGVGGPIQAGPGLGDLGRAVALLRYSGYFSPLPDPGRMLPPGENALYRRDRLAEVESSYADGFWEVEVQEALADRGLGLAMTRSASVAFEGGTGLAAMIRQRFAHARRYGRHRSVGLGRARRIARVGASPLVPGLLVGRVAGALRGRGIAVHPWLPALPALALLASAWAAGEAWGTWKPPTRPGPSFAPSKDRGARPASPSRTRVLS